ncbi:hypothetical protein BC826DRAFT_1111058 [Russula brevipes]|nr:hypothetical protein BC826DRAFT_1111058 [Russula brevipes]
MRMDNPPSCDSLDPGQAPLATARRLLPRSPLKNSGGGLLHHGSLESLCATPPPKEPPPQGLGWRPSPSWHARVALVRTVTSVLVDGATPPKEPPRLPLKNSGGGLLHHGTLESLWSLPLKNSGGGLFHRGSLESLREDRDLHLGRSPLCRPLGLAHGLDRVWLRKSRDCWLHALKIHASSFVFINPGPGPLWRHDNLLPSSLCLKNSGDGLLHRGSLESLREDRDLRLGRAPLCRPLGLAHGLDRPELVQPIHWLHTLKVHASGFIFIDQFNPGGLASALWQCDDLLAGRLPLKTMGRAHSASVYVV